MNKARHKAWLQRLLIAFLDNKEIAPHIFFAGGTCASMLGFLDRFSVDLDFDLGPGLGKKRLRTELHQVFDDLGLEVKDESQNALQFFLRYDAPAGERRDLKIDIIDNPIKSIDYKPQYLKDIDRTAICQTRDSMVSNKMLALTGRKGAVAGRDVYDVHYFLMHGFSYNKEVIREGADQSVLAYLEKMVSFIESEVGQRVIDQDLNTLLTPERFQTIRKSLKEEVLSLLRDEIKKIQ